MKKVKFSTLKIEQLLKKLRVGYVYIEGSFDTIFNMGYGGGAYNAPPPSWMMGRENRPWTRG